MTDRIEEVKKKLAEFDAKKNRAWNKVGCGGTLKEYEAVDEGFARQIDNYYCQLFSQPLDDKELREKIRGAINASIIIHSFKHDDWSLDADKGADQILTLLQPKIEEASCLRKQPITDKIFSAQDLEEAKREERERIIKVVKMPYGDDSHIVTNSLLLFRKHILNRIGKP